MGPPPRRRMNGPPPYADQIELTLFGPGYGECAVVHRGQRAPAPERNHLSVALWVKVGAVQLLLGSDLEECGDPASGWSAIVGSPERPQGLASVFKIPHHGSKTGHHDGVWETMVRRCPVAVLSPFQNGSVRLPTQKDAARILERAPESYITARFPAGATRKRRSAAVERTIRDIVGKLRAAQPRTGWVRIRNGGRADTDNWTVEKGVNACALRALT